MSREEQPAEGPPAAPAEPLFSVDLGLNGGVFAPTTLDELRGWLAREDGLWHWFSSAPGGSHRQQIDQGLASLRNAISAANDAAGQAEGSDTRRRALQNSHNFLRDAFVGRRLPHSDSLTGRRIRQVLDLAGSNAAAAYAGAMTSEGRARFEPSDLESLHGLGLGLSDRYGGADGGLPAARKSFEDLRGELAAARDNEEAVFAKLQREHERLRNDIATLHDAQADDFTAGQEGRAKEWQLLKSEHEDALEKMRDAFRTGMGLRAPVTYWEAKALRHAKTARWLAGVTGTALVCATVALAMGVPWLAPPVGADGKPDSWRLGVLVLAGIFVVWSIRLLVKIFLSELHLAHDATERVTMAKTYLSLQESGGLDDQKASREVVLAALFRPAADGVVKDEGLPPGIAELLTRSK